MFRPFIKILKIIREGCIEKGNFPTSASLHMGSSVEARNTWIAHDIISLESIRSWEGFQNLRRHWNKFRKLAKFSPFLYVYMCQLRFQNRIMKQKKSHSHKKAAYLHDYNYKFALQRHSSVKTQTCASQCRSWTSDMTVVDN